MLFRWLFSVQDDAAFCPPDGTRAKGFCVHTPHAVGQNMQSNRKPVQAKSRRHASRIPKTCGTISDRRKPNPENMQGFFRKHAELSPKTCRGF